MQPVVKNVGLDPADDELEAIAYALSHDMQAPVRSIVSSAEDLQHSPAVNGDATARQAAQSVRGEALRLQAMLQGMREYMQLMTYAPGLAPVDMNEVAAAAIAMLRNEIDAAGAAVACDGLPKVLGHRGRLVRLLAYLIENALKFRGSAPPRIHIAARRMADRWEFYVEDNGIGVPPTQREVIFRLFQRLHGQDYPGYGIGLALARKIVEAHGGTLRVESAPGAGSRFYFTLPPPDNEK